MKNILSLMLLFQIINLSCTNRDNFEGYNNQDHRKIEDKRNNVMNYLALGDSYTIGESVAENKRFPIQLTEKLNAAGIEVPSPTIVATTGWTTDELTAGIQNAELKTTYDLVTLLIGVNNQYRGRDTTNYRSEFRKILQQSIDFASDDPRKVIVISIPDYSATPFAANLDQERISKDIDAFNRINRQETIFKNAHYINITGISRAAKNNPELIANDGLHPSAEMYRLWVEAIFPIAKQILEN